MKGVDMAAQGSIFGSSDCACVSTYAPPKFLGRLADIDFFAGAGNNIDNIHCFAIDEFLDVMSEVQGRVLENLGTQNELAETASPTWVAALSTVGSHRWLFLKVTMD